MLLSIKPASLSGTYSLAKPNSSRSPSLTPANLIQSSCPLSLPLSLSRDLSLTPAAFSLFLSIS